MSERPTPHRRSDYVQFSSITTRWMDNDVYGHLNNAVYYSLFDTAVSGWLREQGLCIPNESSIIGYVVSSSCDYFSSAGFPELLEAGLRVGHVGQSSVRYEVGIFKAGSELAVAQGRFMHAYVDSASRRPVNLPDGFRARLGTLLLPPA